MASREAGGPSGRWWPARDGLLARGRRDLGLAAEDDPPRVDARLVLAVRDPERGQCRARRGFFPGLPYEQDTCGRLSHNLHGLPLIVVAPPAWNTLRMT